MIDNLQETLKEKDIEAPIDHGPNYQPLELEEIGSQVDNKTTVIPVDDDPVNIKGLLYGFVASMCYSITQPVLKMIYLRCSNISSYEVLYWKSISMMVMNYLFVRSFGVFVMDIPRKYHRLIVVRACVGFMGI